MVFKVEKYRIFLSRLAAVIILLLLCGTRSHWETENETIQFILIFAGIILVAVASLGRMWCSLYIAGYKDRKLITKGPYSICRHPLYFFSMIGMIGIGCFTETFTFPIFFAVIYSMYYPFVIRSEEKRLKKLFGLEFEEYLRKVPGFFPRLSAFEEPHQYRVNPVVFRRHIFSAIWFIWVVGIIKAIEQMRQTGLFDSMLALY
jgi:protein-S-isoprenylcysteine O-methyltransferase Ste14